MIGVSINFTNVEVSKGFKSNGSPNILLEHNSKTRIFKNEEQAMTWLILKVLEEDFRFMRGLPYVIKYDFNYMLDCHELSKKGIDWSDFENINVVAAHFCEKTILKLNLNLKSLCKLFLEHWKSDEKNSNISI